ncbi:MAG: CHAT domain-containing protein [Saprospiraceae bacterium]|nr:CHAT domain-containing protein [Saprospiraceae bacterium]
MKNIIITLLAISHVMYCNSQNNLLSLQHFMDHKIKEAEFQYDSLPYHNYNLRNLEVNSEHNLNNIPSYFIPIAKAQFEFIQGNYKKAELIINTNLTDSRNQLRSNTSDFLYTLILKSSIQLKLEELEDAKNTILIADSLVAANKNIIGLEVSSELNLLKASLYMFELCYSDIPNILNQNLHNIIPASESVKFTLAKSNLAIAQYYHKINNLDSVLCYLNKAKTLLSSAGRIESQAYENLNHQLAIYYQNTGNENLYEEYIEKARSMVERKLGKQHPEYANILRTKGNYYRRMGRFNLAELEFRDATEIYLNAEPQNSIYYISTIKNLGSLFNAIGNRLDAEKQFIKAKNILESKKMIYEIDYAIILESLAHLYYNQKKYKDSEQLLLQVLNIRKTSQGNTNKDYAECLNKLANIYLMQENYIKSEILFKEAISITTLECGKNISPYFFVNLGLLYSKTNQFDKSEALFLEVKNIYETNFGKYNKTYLWILDNLAELYTKMNRTSEASVIFIEASQLRKKILFDSFKYLSQNEVEAYLDGFKRGISNFNAFLINTQKPSEELLIEGFENEIFYKGFVLNYHLSLNNALELHPEIISLNNQLKDTYKQIAKENTKFPNSEILIDSLRYEAHILEKRIGRKINGFNDIGKMIKYNELVSRLKSNQSFLEIAYLNTSTESKKDSFYYGAYILHAGSKVPIFIKLCSESELQNQFPKTNTLKSDYVNSLYSIATRGFEPINKRKSNSLYELIWKPLEPYFKENQKIFYTPAGLFHKINFQAIPINYENAIVNKYDVIQLSSSRDKIVTENNNLHYKTALLFGAICYDQEPSQRALKTVPSTLEANTRGATDIIYQLPNSGYWPELKQTFKEINKIANLLATTKIKTRKYSGLTASEDNLKKYTQETPSPSIIHFATHGYFIPLETAETSKTIEENNFPINKIKDPMIRSGLILAKANYAWEKGSAMESETEDGILTALEISQLNFHQTSLVVMSACESGLGDIRGNEGVFGLQRAFKIAGAKNIIMSLWQIPDTQSEELMEAFYTNWLKYKLDIPQSFKQAQLKLKQKYNNPYFWAGFVLVQ